MNESPPKKPCETTTGEPAITMDEDITLDFCTADPDQILPAEKFSTHLRHEPVKLRLKTDGPEAEKPISVPTLLVQTVKRRGHGTALGEYKSFVYLSFGRRSISK